MLCIQVHEMFSLPHLYINGMFVNTFHCCDVANNNTQHTIRNGKTLSASSKDIVYNVSKYFEINKKGRTVSET